MLPKAYNYSYLTHICFTATNTHIITHKMTIKVKICGIKDERAVSAAISAGADFVGFVFYERSPRNVTPEIAGELAKNIPANIKKVAVTVNPADAELEEIIKYLKPDYLQIHKLNDIERFREIKEKFQIKLIKAFEVDDEAVLDDVSKYEEIADIFLFDCKESNAKDSLPGGNGKNFNPKILKNISCKKPKMLAGGLNPTNIKESIILSGADMVDVSSGVEELPGKKSPKLIKSFIEEVQNYE